MSSTSDASNPVEVPHDLVAAARTARRIAVLTGAGMSAESGIPTFRDARMGFWARFNLSKLMSESGFRRDPDYAWGWYEARRADVRRAQPHAGHMALREMAEWQGLEHLAFVTQNVDDLHERAGSENVLHLHGNLFESRCADCDQAHVTEPQIEGLLKTADGKEDRRIPPPRCARCGGMVRPAVVWFDEPLPVDVWTSAVKQVRKADLVLVIGSSGNVYPAASLPEMAAARGCPVWVIDPADSRPSAGTWQWRATAAHALPALVAASQRSV